MNVYHLDIISGWIHRRHLCRRVWSVLLLHCLLWKELQPEPDLWTKSTTTPCTINVCKCQSEVCFLRLDFNSFNIYQPNTDLTVTNPTIASQCDQDVLTISSPGLSSIFIIIHKLD